MRRDRAAVLSVLILVAVLAWSAAAAPAPGADTMERLVTGLQLVPLDGQEAAGFSLDRLDGGRLALADLAGRPALLYFWATW